VSGTQQLAMLLGRISEYDEALALSNALLQRETLIANLPDGDRLMALALATHGSIEHELGHTEPALSAVNRALAYAREVGEGSPVYVDALTVLASVHHSNDNAQASAEVDQQIVDLFTRLYGSDHLLTIQARTDLGISLSQLGQMERALQLHADALTGYRRVMGEDNQNVAGLLPGAVGLGLDRLDPRWMGPDWLDRGAAVCGRAPRAVGD
jgi:tetratricopeptide (TPR) repeat protein